MIIYPRQERIYPFMNSSKLPHTVRLVIFFLRLALGLNFFYLGWSMLFDHSLIRELSSRSLGDLYIWLGSPMSISWLQNFSAWAFLAIGVCLAIGLMTRFASALAIALTFASYFPSVSLSSFAPTELINDGIIVLICLALLIVANAGEYLGIDSFIHVHFGRQKKK